VLYRHRLAGGATTPVTFSSPWRNEEVAAVTVLERATVAVRTGTGEYKVEAAIPLDILGLRPPGGFGADFGVLYGDPAGTMTMLRSYWSNQATGLVSDIPGEIMLTPSLWGALDVEGPR
jgi:hypothetical protein